MASRSIKIDKTLTGEEVRDALESQFPDYKVTANRKCKRIYVTVTGSKGIKFELRKRSIAASKWRARFLGRAFFFVFDELEEFADIFPWDHKRKEVRGFVEERFRSR